ncbi:MAG: oxidoreductase [Bacteroidetes bacterium]|nr:oxidoreductase [Bacteroidota bacterium]MBL0095668.1 oxidoreductase [Bacteroidota bacterium]
MAYQFSDATVVNIIDENERVKRYFIKVPDEVPFSFKAGQFIMLDLPIASKYTNRSYSIASPPSDDNIFELCIVLNDKGLGTPYIWEHYQIGTAVKISKVLGKFQLPETIDRDICFIGTGTGVAPLRSQILDILNKGIPHRNLYLVFGNRWEKDILYRKEMEGLQEKFPTFKFLPVLSRANEGWKGLTGYVHTTYEEIFKDHRSAYFYICGWADMLKEARHRLEVMGYDRKSIRFESYD